MAQLFNNMAPWYGITHSYNGIDGGGSTIHDWDRDGWDDFVLTNNGVCRFYRNTGDGFELIPPFVSESYHVKQLSFVDFDNDGDPDIFLTCHLQRFRLFENTGNLNFVEISYEAGLPALIIRHFGHAWTDYNRDGWPDLYVASYAVNQDAKNFMFRNNGNGTFTEVAEALGVDDGYKFTFQPVFSDFNNDGWPDLFLANDKISPNKLYINNGGVSFTDVSAAANIEIIIDAMSATVGDSNNDGFDDIYVTNSHVGNSFHVNNGNLTFDDQAEDSGTATNLFCWGAQWLDGDNDGLRDLFVATDFAGNLGEDYRNRFFKNLGGNQFESLYSIPFTTSNFRSFSPAVGDFNNDGYADLLLNNHSPTQSQLWINQSQGNHFVKVKLKGTLSNADAIGSLITVQSGELIQTHFTKCGEAYLAQNSSTVCFGLGANDSLTSISIQWPSGLVESYQDLGADSCYVFTEGQSFQNSVLTNIPNDPCGQTGNVYLTTGEGQPGVWNTGQISDTLYISQSGWYYYSTTPFPGLTVISDSIYVPYNPEFNASIEYSSPLCYGDSNGWAQVLVSGATDDLTFSWSDGHTASQYPNLPSGLYEVNVQNDSGCSHSFEFEITEPAELLVTVTTTDAPDALSLGQAEASVSGGTAPYNLLWPNVNETGYSIDLLPGSYGIWVTDDNDCSAFSPFSIGFISTVTNFLNDGEFDLRVSENPCDKCHFSFFSGGIQSKAIISDLSGRIILDINLSKQETNHDFDASFNLLNPGVYTVSLISEKFKKTIKVLKEK